MLLAHLCISIGTITAKLYHHDAMIRFTYYWPFGEIQWIGHRWGRILMFFFVVCRKTSSWINSQVAGDLTTPLVFILLYVRTTKYILIHSEYFLPQKMNKKTHIFFMLRNNVQSAKNQDMHNSSKKLTLFSTQKLVWNNLGLGIAVHSETTHSGLDDHGTHTALVNLDYYMIPKTLVHNYQCSAYHKQIQVWIEGRYSLIITWYQPDNY